jgi:hypothetical protein
VILEGRVEDIPVKYSAPHVGLVVPLKRVIVTPVLSITVAVYVPAEEYVWEEIILEGEVPSPQFTVAAPEELSVNRRGPIVAPPAGIVNVNSIYIG